MLRFAYMRYANGLLKEGRKLLHWLTHILVGAFIVNFLLIWPVKYIWRGENYQDSVKGKLCMKAVWSVYCGVFIDQLKNGYLQVHSSRLGPDMTSNIWWIQLYFENKIACFKVKLSWTRGSFFVLSP